MAISMQKCVSAKNGLELSSCPAELQNSNKKMNPIFLELLYHVLL